MKWVPKGGHKGERLYPAAIPRPSRGYPAAIPRPSRGRGNPMVCTFWEYFWSFSLFRGIIFSVLGTLRDIYARYHAG